MKKGQLESAIDRIEDPVKKKVATRIYDDKYNPDRREAAKLRARKEKKMYDGMKVKVYGLDSVDQLYATQKEAKKLQKGHTHYRHHMRDAKKKLGY
jgi:hypothetical protein